jgi:DNA repair protein RadC
MTKQIIAAARPLGVLVHDQIIVGLTGYFSMKGKKII